MWASGPRQHAGSGKARCTSAPRPSPASRLADDVKLDAYDSDMGACAYVFFLRMSVKYD